MTATGCPLCDRLAVIENEPEHEVIYQFDSSIAVLGAHQYYRGYCVLISRTHATELSQLNPEDELPLFLAEMCLLAGAIERAFQPRKLNYELLGNQVGHLHWHIFPRAHDDLEPLSPVWLPLHRAETDPALKALLTGDPAERPAIARLIREQLESE